MDQIIILNGLLKHRLRVGLILLIWASIPLITNAQAAQRILDGEVINFRSNENIQGSYLLFDNWQIGSIEDLEGNVTTQVKLNYHTFDETFLSLLEDGQVLKLNKYLYRKIAFDQDTFINLAMFKMTGFGRIIYYGKNLKCFEKVVGRKNTANKKAYNTVNSKYQIIQKSNTLLIMGEEVIELRRKMKFLEKYFHKKELKKLKDQLSLDIKKDDDLKIVLNYFDH